jgi:hypothetical protein
MKVRVENNPKNASMEVGTLPLCCSISASKILPKLCYVQRVIQIVLAAYLLPSYPYFKFKHP